MQAVSAIAAAAIIHPSYRVMHIAARARPGAVGHSSIPRSIHSASNESVTNAVAKSNGSVMGVLWMYSRFGLVTKRAAAVAPPAIDPVEIAMSRARAHAVIPVHRTDSATPEAP